MKRCCIYEKLRNTDRMTIRLDGFFVRAKGGGLFQVHFKVYRAKLL